MEAEYVPQDVQIIFNDTSIAKYVSPSASQHCDSIYREILVQALQMLTR